MPGFPRCGRLSAAASVSTDAFSGGLRPTAGGRLSGGRRKASRMCFARAVRNDAAGSRRAEQLRGYCRVTAQDFRRWRKLAGGSLTAEKQRCRSPQAEGGFRAAERFLRPACPPSGAPAPPCSLRDVRRESGLGRAKDRVSFWNLPSEFVLYALLQSRRASFERCDPLLRNRMPSVPAWLPPRFAGRPQLFVCGTPLR